MSLIFTQDWEDASWPSTDWSISGLTMKRSAVATVMDGAKDARLDTTAGGGSWTLSWPPLPWAPSGGSRRGSFVQARFKFMFERATPITGAALSVLVGNGVHGLIINDGSFKLCLQGMDLSQTLGATSLVEDTVYVIDTDFRYETDTGFYARAWLDGVLEVEHRDPVGSGSNVMSFLTAGDSLPKGTCTARWGDMKIWAGRDPQ